MHRGLLRLLRLQARSVVRRIFRGAKTPRGALFLLVGVIVFILWLVPSVINTMTMPRPDLNAVRMYFPLGMLGYCILTLVSSAGERAVAFTPAEVDFLFPGPFSRRQLLLYKIARSALGAMFSALIFSLIFMRYAQHWINGWAAMFLALLFMQLLSMTVVLVGQTIGEHAYTRARRLILIGVSIAVVSIIAPRLTSGGQRSLPEIAQQFVESTSGRIVLAPFSVFAHVLTAPAVVPEAIKWSGIALAMIAGMMLVVMQLDAHYLESAAVTGQKVYEQSQRYRRGGGLAYRASGSRLRLPMLPRMGGAGTITWRQLVTALRTSRTMLIVLLLICLAVGPLIFFGNVRIRPAQLATGAVIWLTLLLSNMLRFDFRGDLDRIDTLKALPLRATAVVVAQLLAPVMVLTVCQLVLLSGVAVLMRADLQIIAMLALFALPFNAVLIAVENLVFLIFPERTVAVSPGDLQGFGRQVLVLLLKSIVMLFAAGVAGGFGALAWWLSEGSIAAAVLVCFVVLSVEAIGMIPLLVLAFTRFDPSVDTPA